MGNRVACGNPCCCSSWRLTIARTRRRREERENEELVRKFLSAEAEEVARRKTYPCPIWYATSVR
jgi:Fe-S-cluster containining protein